MSSCFPSAVKSWPKQYLSGQDSIVCYRKSGLMLLSLHILHLLMQNRQTCPQYIRHYKNILICEWTLSTSMQQLYVIAQQVKWPKPDIFEPHIFRLGGFHSLSTFIFTLGKPWADEGFATCWLTLVFMPVA